MELIDSAFSGYNYSLFAYGQTGSGKSHSMVGFGTDVGIIPRACQSIFSTIKEKRSLNLPDSDTTTEYAVTCSMLEIYNERVRDLFTPLSTQPRAGLRIRDSPKTGAYVEGLKLIPVLASEQISRLLQFGTRNRTVAATNMNETSSRAHTIFAITLTQTRTNRSTTTVSDVVSSINLIDLAGSERANKTGATGDRLTEGGHINKSLSALGNVINALAKNETSSAKKKLLVPYRDAVLTHLLKNALGGNSKTTMIAAVSPSPDNYAESLSTLRYADRAKSIKNAAVINEDENEKLIRQLREEMDALRALLANSSTGDIEQLKAAEREKIKAELEAQFAKERAEWEKTLGASESIFGGGEDEGGGGNEPRLVNLNEDKALSGVLIYNLGQNLEYSIGAKPSAPPHITIGGMGVFPKHAKLSRGQNLTDISLTPLAGGRTLLNGSVLAERVGVRLNHNDRLIFGNNSVFRVDIPGVEVGVDDPTVDWEFAMQESNNETLSSLRKAGQEEDRNAEVARVAMEDRLLRLERELKNSTEGKSDLEAKLQTATKETEKLLARQAADRHSRNLIDRQLLHTLPLVHEANEISAELNKGLKFSVKLVSKSVEGELGNGEVSYKTDVCVTIVDTNNEDKCEPALWSHAKFHNRIYIMREMYHTVKENGGKVEGTEFEREECSPFYDPREDVLIGVARLQLEAVKYLLDVEEATPLVDYRGVCGGELLVSMVPRVGEGEDDVEDLSEVIDSILFIQIAIKGVRGLPVHKYSPDVYKSLYVKYRFFAGDEYEMSDLVGMGRDVEFEWGKEMKWKVSAELCEYVAVGAVGFEVWACEKEVKDAVGGSVGEEEEEEEEAVEPETMEQENVRLRAENEELREKLGVALKYIEGMKEGEGSPRAVARMERARVVDEVFNS